MNIYINVTNGHSVIMQFPSPRPIVADDIREWIESLLNFLIFVFGVLGVGTNAVNIWVFFQQGLFSDSSTVGLFALAIADFLGCLLLLPSTACAIFRHTANPGLAFTCVTWFSLIFPLPHIGMSRLTCWITVYIAVERSLCVLIPFKVKMLMQPKVTAAAMFSMYVINFAIYFPIYVNTAVEWRHHRLFNTTVAIYTETALAKVIRNYMSLILNTVMSTVAVIIVAIATGLMLYKLHKMQKWREKNVASAASKQGSIPNQKVGGETKNSDNAKGKKDVEILTMVVMVTGLFLVCLSMSHFPGFASAFVPGFSVTGVNRNLFYLLYWYKFLFDLINSSLNFFFYIRISSRYKAAFVKVFQRRSK